MNCQDINHLLDANAVEVLPRTQRDAIDRHLASCRACREDWANWGEIAALSIPSTPVALRTRIAAALPTQREAPGRRAFRPFVVGGLVLAGAALAAIVALQLAQPDAAPALAELSPPAAPAGRGGEESAVSQPSEVPDLPAESSNPDSEDAAADFPIDPHTIVVLKRPEATADALAIAIATQCHDAIVRRLRTVAGLKVIADSALLPYEGGAQVTRLKPGAARFRLLPSDGEIARRLGAGNVLVVSTENGCNTEQFNSQTGDMITGMMSGNPNDPGDGWDSFATSLVRSVSDKTLKNEATVSGEARAALLNTALSEDERAGALWKLESNARGVRSAGRSAFDNDVVAAAVQLGTKSASASVRSVVWAALREVDDPSLAQPLLQALANDPDARVRMQAALTLNTFLDRPGVREALQRAAAEDPSREPEVPCCMLSVRDAAERALIPDKDLGGWALRKLFDESLPARSRLLAMDLGSTPDGRRMPLTTADVGTETAGVVFAIGRNEQDPRVRQMAWNALWGMKPDEAFLPVLLGDLNGHPDESVRAAAAKVLARYTGNPEVRAALERALNDPSMAVRRRATP